MLFGLSDLAKAEEKPTEKLNYAVVRALPLVQEAELKVGEYVEFNVGGFFSNQLASKFKVKFKIESCEPETIVVDRFGLYNGRHQRYSSFAEYGTYGTIDFVIPKDLPRGENLIGKERIRVMNVSATTLKIKVGLASGIHVKSQEGVNYNDIDFKL
ncbi:hypothetical protein [Enterococcus sp. AZ177]